MARPSVAVGAARRGQGLGQALATAALDLGRQRGVATVYLLTETAAGFFPKLGFRPITRADERAETRQRKRRAIAFLTVRLPAPAA